MSINYSTAVKDARMAAVQTAINGGTGEGRLELGPTGLGSIYAAFLMGTTGNQTITTGQLNFGSFDQTVNATGNGLLQEAQIVNGDGTIVVSGITVGTTGTEDIVLDANTVVIGQDVRIVSFQLTHG